MPKLTKKGDVKRSELPSTVRRSPAKAQRTFAKAHDAAVEEYGEGRRAHQTAYAALAHSFEKAGDHYEPKAGDLSRRELYESARRLDIPGRSSMNKGQLLAAVKKATGTKRAASR